MADRKTIQTYGERAQDYLNLKPAKIQDDALAGFLAQVAPGGHILDLGCGPGVQAAAMQVAGFTVTAFDATPDFVTAARARGVDARLATFDDLTEQAHYDGIWASFSLLHAPRAEFPRHLGACHRALKTGGTLFLGLKTGTGEGRDSIGRFYSYYSEDDLRQALGTAGFSAITAITGTGPGLTGNVEPFILMTAHA
jgi:SAM-dependent methyltransferase